MLLNFRRLLVLFCDEWLDHMLYEGAELRELHMFSSCCKKGCLLIYHMEQEGILDTCQGKFWVFLTEVSQCVIPEYILR